MRVSGRGLVILLDTQAIVWLILDDRRLSRAALRAVTAGTAVLHVSAVTAFEFEDLNRRGRFGADLPLQAFLERFGATVLDLPASLWHVTAALPNLHRDPVDRMLVAHVIHVDATLITADAVLRSYPVRSIW